MYDKMVIASLDAKGWNKPTHTQNQVQNWEVQTGVILPEPYRSFIIRYNGGRPFPNIFDIPATSSSPAEAERMIERFFSAQTAISFYAREAYGEGTPAEFFFIAEDPGGFEILLSLAQDNFGQIFGWHHSTYTWGTEDNNSTHLRPLAPDFRSFIDSIYLSSDRDLGYDSWTTPAHEQNKVELVLD